MPEIPENGPQNHQYGELILKSGELLYKKHVVVEDKLDGYANIAAEFSPTYEITSPTDPMFSFLRFYIWLTRIAPRIPSSLVKFDHEAEFQKLFPFSIITYAEFIASFAMHAVLGRQALTYDRPLDPALRKDFFRNSSIPGETIECMFETLSFSLDNMPKPRDTLGYGDFEFLKDRPYFLFNGEMHMLDSQNRPDAPTAIRCSEIRSAWYAAQTPRTCCRLRGAYRTPYRRFRHHGRRSS